MGTGPSPTIPFLLIITLGLVIHGGSLMTSVSLLTDAEQATLDFVLVILLLVLLLVYFTESIIVPFSLVLLTYMVGRMLLGPLVLIFVIYFVSIFVASLEPYRIESGTNHEREIRNEHEQGLVLLPVIFLFLSSLLCNGDRNEWGIVLIAMVLYLFYDLSQQSSF